MPMNQIFFYGKTKSLAPLSVHFFNNEIFHTFETDNAYKLVQYSKEIHPQVMILNLKGNNDDISDIIIDKLGANIKVPPYPIIVLQPSAYSFHTHSAIAHYLHTPIDLYKLPEIVESYTRGRKKHDILLLQSYSSQKGIFVKKLEEANYSYFEVNNGEAALQYLSKNNPKIVCIEYNPKFISYRHSMNHKFIFYVDRQQDITEIEKFLY